MARPTRLTNRIAALRGDAGRMTQQHLADRIGVTRQTVNAIELGKYSPSLEVAFKIARELGFPLEGVFQYPKVSPAADLVDSSPADVRGAEVLEYHNTLESSAAPHPRARSDRTTVRRTSIATGTYEQLDGAGEHIVSASVVSEPPGGA